MSSSPVSIIASSVITSVDVVTASSTSLASNIHSFPTVELFTSSTSSSSASLSLSITNEISSSYPLSPGNTKNSQSVSAIQTPFPSMSSPPPPSPEMDPRSEGNAGGNALYAAVGGLAAAFVVVLIAVLLGVFFVVLFIRRKKNKSSEQKITDLSNPYYDACKLSNNLQNFMSVSPVSCSFPAACIKFIGEETKSKCKGSRVLVESESEQGFYDKVEDNEDMSNATYSTVDDTVESDPPQDSSGNVNGNTTNESLYHTLEDPTEACYDAILPSKPRVRFH